MGNDTLYLLSAIANNHRTVLITPKPVRAGDIVSYRVQGEEFLCKVQAVIQTERNSELHNWILTVTNAEARKVTDVYQPDIA